MELDTGINVGIGILINIDIDIDIRHLITKTIKNSFCIKLFHRYCS